MKPRELLPQKLLRLSRLCLHLTFPLSLLLHLKTLSRWKVMRKQHLGGGEGFGSKKLQRGLSDGSDTPRMAECYLEAPSSGESCINRGRLSVWVPLMLFLHLAGHLSGGCALCPYLPQVTVLSRGFHMWPAVHRHKNLARFLPLPPDFLTTTPTSPLWLS